MCLAYTSFAVRMLQGRDILKSTAAALPAEALFDLCDKFGAGGAQLDWSQIVSVEPAALAALRKRVERVAPGARAVGPVEVSRDAEAYAEMVRVAHGAWRRRASASRCSTDGATRRSRHATSGRRGRAKWRTTLLSMRKAFDDSPIIVGIENHKDWHAAELVELLQLIDSPQRRRLRRLRQQHLAARIAAGHGAHAGAVSPSRRISRTWRSSRPRRASDCLKCRLAKASCRSPRSSRSLRAQRPDVPMCLEMITRDPLPVPYKTDRYWVAIDRPSPDVLARFEQEVLGKAGRATCRRSRASAPRRRSPPKTRTSGDRSTTPRRTLKL